MTDPLRPTDRTNRANQLPVANPRNQNGVRRPFFDLTIPSRTALTIEEARRVAYQALSNQESERNNSRQALDPSRFNEPLPEETDPSTEALRTPPTSQRPLSPPNAPRATRPLEMAVPPLLTEVTLSPLGSPTARMHRREE